MKRRRRLPLAQAESKANIEDAAADSRSGLFPTAKSLYEKCVNKLDQGFGLLLRQFITKCRLFKKNGWRHFLTRRFDCLAGGEELHIQSLCAQTHCDFNIVGVYAYKRALLVIRQMGLPMAANLHSDRPQSSDD